MATKKESPKKVKKVSSREEKFAAAKKEISSLAAKLEKQAREETGGTAIRLMNASKGLVRMAKTFVV
tara:strand:- start:480 stop:680 length:201 start_codon:yes stop_codon:yes gene_type:complete